MTRSKKMGTRRKEMRRGRDNKKKCKKKDIRILEKSKIKLIE